MAYFRCTGNSGGSLKLRTAQGEIASFETNLPEPLQSVKCSINPIQNGTPWIDSNVINKEPYIKRAVAGTATRIGNHLYDKLVGGTVAFNQLVKNGNFADTDNWNYSNVVFSVSDNIASLTANVYRGNISNRVSIENGHKILFMANVKLTTASELIRFGILTQNGNAWAGYKFTENNTNWQTIGSICVSNANDNNNFVMIRDERNSDFDTIQIKNVMIIDLTAFFGSSTIADYVYSLESGTAGAGVAWFRNLFPKDYYAYNAGELMSVKATAHVMKNASNTVIGNYALDSNLELRGLFKLDANNKLYADGDTYESSGDVTRGYRLFNCAVDTFGVTKNVSSDATDWLYYFTRYDISDDSVPTDVISQTFETVDYAPTRQNGKKCCLNKQFHVIYINMYGLISTNNEETAKQWLVDNAVKFLYKKTPTTEQASPFTNPQVCDENGTEEYTDSRAVAIPVGHETYQANICPINGYTEANITRCGVNLWDEETAVYGSHLISKNYIPCKGEETYYLKAPVVSPQTFGNGFSWYDKDKVKIGSDLYPTGNQTLTAPSNACFFKFELTSNYGTTYNNDISINYPATDTTYHAYNGQTYTIAFGQTVYGGVLDVTRGKLHITHLNLDVGSVLFTYSSRNDANTGNVFFYLMNSAKTNSSMLSSAFSNVNYPSWTAIDVNTGGFRGNYLILCAEYPNAVSFKTAMNGVQCVYELATPFDIDLTPVQIRALVGENNVFADCGETEVEYLKVE